LKIPKKNNFALRIALRDDDAQKNTLRHCEKKEKHSHDDGYDDI
jgi:hypothetical protein